MWISDKHVSIYQIHARYLSYLCQICHKIQCLVPLWTMMSFCFKKNLCILTICITLIYCLSYDAKCHHAHDRKITLVLNITRFSIISNFTRNVLLKTSNLNVLLLPKIWGHQRSEEKMSPKYRIAVITRISSRSRKMDGQTSLLFNITYKI